MTRQTFFEDLVLERDLRDDSLRLAVRDSQILDLVTGGFADRVAGKTLLTRFENVLSPAVVQVGHDAFSSAELRDARLASQPFEHDPDLLFRRELPPGSVADLAHGRFAGLLLLFIDRSGTIVAEVLTEGDAHDSDTALNLIDEIDDIASFTADAAYDTIAIYGAAAARGAKVIVPPRKAATKSKRPSARDRTVRRVRKLGRRQ